MEQEGWTTPHAYGDTTTFGGFLYGNLIATEDDEMSQYIEAELDEKVIPLVQFFNANGLPTLMSCQGHNKTNLSMFWIEFDKTVTEADIVAFMRGHLNWVGMFCSCGRFAKRIYASHNSVYECWCYFAATVEAANADLYQWMHDAGEWQGVDGERYQAWQRTLAERKNTAIAG